MESITTTSRETGNLPTSKLDRLIGVPELAERLGISPYTIYRWCHHQTIPYFRLGRKSLFDPVEVEAWLEQKKIEPVGGHHG